MDKTEIPRGLEDGLNDLMFALADLTAESYKQNHLEHPLTLIQKYLFAVVFRLEVGSAASEIMTAAVIHMLESNDPRGFFSERADALAATIHSTFETYQAQAPCYPLDRAALARSSAHSAGVSASDYLECVQLRQKQIELIQRAASNSPTERHSCPHTA